MRVSVLGPVEARLGDGDDAPLVDLGGPKQRALLAALALHRGRPVSTDQLVDLLWARDAPPGAAQTLQNHVAGLRRALEPHRAARTPAQVVVTAAPGYALQLPAGALDVDAFESVVGRVHRLLKNTAPLPAGAASAPPVVASPAPDVAETAVADLDRSLAAWRGVPYLDLGDAPSAAAERVRLEELRMVALEDRAVAALALGRHATVAAELESLTMAHPLRERLWALRAVALTRSGRQADALDVLARVRALLLEELGIEPGPELQALQTAVLRQDPSLAWTAPPAPATPATTPAPTASTPSAVPPRPTASPWPLVGRDAERDALVGLLDQAGAGSPRFAALVGEPGIGKSRLLAELAAAAQERSATVLVGRCSQDEGAPPLWPWAGVLEGLGRPLPTEEGHTDEGTRFRSWDEIVRTVRDAAADRLVLLLLDDLHWADVSSLRVLGLLLETLQDGRLVLVATWRADPPPSGSLGVVAEQLARRHALRLDLTGLDPAEVTTMVEAVAHRRPDLDQARALRDRTDGNPFFVLEYARLLGDHGDLVALLAEPTPPHGVTDVVRRRVERLADDARSALVPAAVLGRDFALRDLAAVLTWDEDRVLDALDEAVAAGLVREDGVDSFRFAHALVRDTVHATLSPSRRARWHARVAAVLETRPGRAGEVARHWHEAGPEYAGRAWRADRVAAREALRLYAYEEAVELLTEALVALAQDATATDQDEYDVLVELGLADKASGDWINLREVVHRGITVADRLGDPVALARVAVMTSIDALWQAAYHGEVDEVVVDALRRSLEALPTADDELRCRAMLALAGELYYGVTAQERDALAAEGVAMARRIGDPTLLTSTCQTAFVVTWRPGTVEQRVALATEALEIAEQIQDERMLIYARTLRALVASEAGDVTTYAAQVEAARRLAEEHRNLYSLVVLDSLEIPWCAMRGEFERAGKLLEHMQAVGERMGLSQQTDAVRGALLAIMVWQEQYEPVLEVLQASRADEALPVDTAILSMLARLGRLDEARALRAEQEIDFGGDTWFSWLPWAMAADAALPLGDAELGATAYRLLAPHVGRMACAGSGVTLGPVDMYLAMAAAATGELDLAARHADAALELCEAWRIPLVRDWFTRQRDRYAF
jgi:DNA-binding SARP family transcriptional activator